MDALIAVSIVFLVGYLLYRRSKNRVLIRMNLMGNAAKMVTYSQIANDLRRTHSGLGEDLRSRMAAARTNYLFGEKVGDKHSGLDSESESLDAVTWLNNHDGIRELVVQALRVFNVINMQRSGTSDLKGIRMLELYGHEFPEAASVDSFHSILTRELDRVRSPERDEIRQQFQL